MGYISLLPHCQLPSLLLCLLFFFLTFAVAVLNVSSGLYELETDQHFMSLQFVSFRLLGQCFKLLFYFYFLPDLRVSSEEIGILYLEGGGGTCSC